MPSQVWVRLVLAISLDGRLAPAAGGAAQLGGASDRRVLEEALAWADGALLGSGTLRAHRSTCLIHDQDLLEQRLSAGRSAQPKVVVVSRQQGHSLDWPFFQQPIQRWLLSSQQPTGEDSTYPLPSAGYERQFLLASSWPQTLNRLVEAGLSKLVLLGGAQLLTSMLQDDAVDELQLTLTPRLLGGGHAWVPLQSLGLPEALMSADSWCLQEVKPLAGHELLLRYWRHRPSSLPNGIS
ncbi:MAG: RibD family protein [Prochlorococcus sp.]|nr:dihydrofolate reductase family protein [Prochlorococcaceae cyanobacterium ETNP18_MAG_1]